jgi:hypothetical protein
MCVNEAQKVYELYGASDRIQYVEIDDYNHLSNRAQDIILKAMDKMQNEI